MRNFHDRRTAAGRTGLDATDIAILEILQREGRIGFSELGRRIGLSQPATSERVKRLEECGVITGYGARLDAAALGLPMMAVLRLRTTHAQIRACLKQFAAMPGVIEVLRITGEDCFLIKVLVPAPEKLEALVDDVARHGAVTTSLVLRAESFRPLGWEVLRGVAGGKRGSRPHGREPHG